MFYYFLRWKKRLVDNTRLIASQYQVVKLVKNLIGVKELRDLDTNKDYLLNTHLPVFVIIISVPRSWNLSHNSFVSRWHWIGRRSSELHDPVIWRLCVIGRERKKHDVKFRFNSK